MRRLFALAAVLLLVPVADATELTMPPGFTVQSYVTGEGFEGAVAQGVRGIPSMTTAVVDAAGVLYLSRPGRRYFAGEVQDIFSVYRIPPGGARLTPDSEPRYLYGPPLPNPHVVTTRGAGELFVTTFDRERRIGVLYRIVDGLAELVAGGTPAPGGLPLFRQPEGVAIDSTGHLYVADRVEGRVTKLAPTGAVVNAQWFTVVRPRLLLMDAGDRLWVAADGPAEAPWQRGPGEIWHVNGYGLRHRVVQGPVASGLALGPAGTLFVADRHAAKIFVITAEGRQEDFAMFREGDAPRAIAFVPDTPETRGAGIAGDLLVVRITRGAWRVNEVVRIVGPFESFVRERLAP